MRLTSVIALLLTGSIVAASQQRADPQLLAYIKQIKAIDNHCHDIPAADMKLGDNVSDPLGTSPVFFDARQRETDGRWLQAWRALYGYTGGEISKEKALHLFQAKQKVMRAKGVLYPEWVLDHTGIEVAIVNSSHLGPGQASPRFRWVPFADGFLFPFEYRDPTGNVQRRRQEIGLDKPPPTLSDYLKHVVNPQLEKWKQGGAIAIKFQIAYYRSLDFANPKESDATAVYEKYVQGGLPPSAEYKILQDFLFRYVSREAGRLGLSIHVHTGLGGGPFFGVSGSNPLLLEPVLNDYTLRGTNFVLIHGGYPFDRAISSLLQKPNVYTDISGQDFFRSPHELADTLQEWLERFPEKVMFGTDAFQMSRLRSWEEMSWIAAKGGREALALALTRMILEGDITRSRAREIAQMVMRGNATKLYGFAKD